MKKLLNLGRYTKIILVMLLPILIYFLFISKNSFARFVYLGIKDYYLETKSFYFNCDKMDNPEAFYQIDNWAGGGELPITFNMNSKKNNMVNSTSDIYYDITYSCSSNVSCTSTKNDGVIFADSNTDFFIVTLTPEQTLVEGDSVWLKVSAKSSSPYIKEISGKIVLNISIPGLSYEIQDEVYQPYLNFKVTNTRDFYTVKEAFGSYTVGSAIDIKTYASLTDSEKEKCSSATVKLTFDPNVVLVDLTSEMYSSVVSTTQIVIDGHEYINSITFKLEPISSQIVRFYKSNPDIDYTYPFVYESSIIVFNEV